MGTYVYWTTHPKCRVIYYYDIEPCDFLEPCRIQKKKFFKLFLIVRIFLTVLRCHFWQQMSPQGQITKICSKDKCLIHSQPTFLILCYLLIKRNGCISNSCEPDKFKPHESLKLGLNNIRGPHSDFACNIFFFKSNSLEFSCFKREC